MTGGLLTSSRTKSKLLMKTLKQPSTSNIEKYKTYLKCFNRIKGAAKEKNYHDVIEQNKQDIKNTWKILKTIIGKQNDKSNLPQNFIIDNKQISDKVVIAEEFNKFFSHIGKKTSKNVPNTHRHHSDYLLDSNKNSMYLEPVNEI